MKITNPLNKQKSNSKSKSKVKAGGKKQQRPLWQKASLVVVVFVLIGAAGSFGYIKWRENDLLARAGKMPKVGVIGRSGRPVSEPDTANVYACKNIVNSIYGQVFQVTVMYERLSNRRAWTNTGVHKYGYSDIKWSPTNHSWFGKIQVNKVLAGSTKSKNAIRFYVATYDEWGNAVGGEISAIVNNLQNCN